jgi:hypothetical protein
LQYACSISVDVKRRENVIKAIHRGLIVKFQKVPSEQIGQNVLFVPTHLSTIINEGGAASELVEQLGTDLQKFRKALTRSQVENSTHYHSK